MNTTTKIKPSAAQWNAALSTFRAAEATYRQADDDSDLDNLCNAMCQAQSALMAVPAPDHAALLVKLEELLSITNGSTDSWSEDYAGQTIEDMRRLLK